VRELQFYLLKVFGHVSLETPGFVSVKLPAVSVLRYTVKSVLSDIGLSGNLY
jgi:hypothetical protein